MKIVLDTNVLISGLLIPNSNPDKILKWILDELITVCVDERIVAEYREVLDRGGWPFREDRALDILELIDDRAIWIRANPLNMSLPDSDDRMFIEVAVSAKADALITGNRKHFPAQAAGIPILAPSRFIELFESIHKS